MQGVDRRGGAVDGHAEGVQVLAKTGQEPASVRVVGAFGEEPVPHGQRRTQEGGVEVVQLRAVRVDGRRRLGGRERGGEGGHTAKVVAGSGRRKPGDPHASRRARRSAPRIAASAR
jgi:hypothetical protein